MSFKILIVLMFAAATFDPAEGSGYQRVDTSAGTMLISFLDAKPHLDNNVVVTNSGSSYCSIQKI